MCVCVAICAVCSSDATCSYTHTHTDTVMAFELLVSFFAALKGTISEFVGIKSHHAM